MTKNINQLHYHIHNAYRHMMGINSTGQIVGLPHLANMYYYMKHIMLRLKADSKFSEELFFPEEIMNGFLLLENTSLRQSADSLYQYGELDADCEVEISYYDTIYRPNMPFTFQNINAVDLLDVEPIYDDNDDEVTDTIRDEVKQSDWQLESVYDVAPDFSMMSSLLTRPAEDLFLKVFVNTSFFEYDEDIHYDNLRTFVKTQIVEIDDDGHKDTDASQSKRILEFLDDLRKGEEQRMREELERHKLMEKTAAKESE